MSSGGINQFMRELDKRMREISAYQSTSGAVLGTILPDFSLKADNLPYVIPSGSYSVGRTVREGIRIGGEEILKPLAAGDRVLVAVYGAEYVVIDVID